MDYPVAIISDIHGNANAFEAVLADIHSLDIRRIVNIGDTIGYGPEPERCVDLAMENCAVNLCGNHEYAVLNSAEGFNPVAKHAVEYVRERLQPGDESDPARRRRWQFITELPTSYRCDAFAAMHGSPRHEVMEYVLPSDPDVDPLKIDEIFLAMDYPVAFVGHTHFPAILVEGEDIIRTVPELGGRYALAPHQRVVVNVGSVGQPRDRDVRSCYVVFDGETVIYRRVEYNVESTVQKIRDSGRLHDSLGHRLLEGR